MIQQVLSEVTTYNSHILKFLKHTPEVQKKMLELCSIKDIPEYLHTFEICKRAVDDDPYNIAYINLEFINDEILCIFFKHELTRHIPRSDRFSLISQFDEARIIKILQYRPMLISHLRHEQRTYNVLKNLVTFSGYSLQYLTKEEMKYNNEEFVKIALENEPLAKKYL
jgi:hypothetical protein